MKALLLDSPGSPTDLRVGEIPIPNPQPGQIRVRVRACGLNPVDVSVAAGGVPDWQWPHILGLDVAGEVDMCGPGVTEFHRGQRVAFHADLRHQGGFAQFSVVSADVVAPIPDQVSYTQAAALPCAGMTAYQAIFRRLHVQADHKVLVTAGAGGVGGFAIQLAKSVGAYVITTCSASNEDYVRALGADAVIDYRTQNIGQEVVHVTDGAGLDGIVDTVSSQSATDNLRLLNHGGAIACIAGRADLSVIEPFTTAPSVHEIALGAAHSYGRARQRSWLRADLSELLELVARGKLNAMVCDRLQLDDVPSGLARLAGRHVRGKLVYISADN